MSSVADESPLFLVQQESYRAADAALAHSWPPERAMGASELAAFLIERSYCVLATTTSLQRPQARPVAFVALRETIWFATVAGGRLRNVERTPWVSMVIAEGEGDTHRAVVIDGPVTVKADPGDNVVALWERKLGSRADWAAAWFELRPQRLFSYTFA